MNRLLLLPALVPFEAEAQARPLPGGLPAVGVMRAERQQVTQGRPPSRNGCSS